MNLQELLVTIHILAVAVWFGGSIMLSLFGFRTLNSGDLAQKTAFTKTAEAAGRLLMIGGIATAVFGIWAVIESDFWEFSDSWIGIGIGAAALGAVLGAAFFAPQVRRAFSLYSAGDEAQGDRVVRKIATVAQFELLVLLITVAVMVAKPGA